MDIRLRPIRDDEFPAFSAESERGFAEDLAHNGGWEHEVAQAKAEADFARFFPDGAPAEGHLVFVIEADGAPAGIVWFGIDIPSFEPGAAFLFDIHVEPELRGRGIGRAAMLAFEEKARELGARRTTLNVFGGNAVARGLYTSLGYGERAVVMSKSL